MTPLQIKTGRDDFLFDGDLLKTVSGAMFTPDHYRQRDKLQGQAQGRGETFFIRLAADGVALDCVLRHYRRGGLVARVNHDRYWWTGLEHTRAWREWHLLADMVNQDLPVPRPVAARVRRCGLFHKTHYRADLITVKIADTRPLSNWLTEAELGVDEWRGIGAVIARIHQAGFYHSDLNAHNILLRTRGDDKGKCFVIDFDKGEKRAPDAMWQQANLARLQRSLLKLAGEQPGIFHFSDRDWQALLDGYS